MEERRNTMNGKCFRMNWKTTASRPSHLPPYSPSFLPPFPAESWRDSGFTYTFLSADIRGGLRTKSGRTLPFIIPPLKAILRFPLPRAFPPVDSLNIKGISAGRLKRRFEEEGGIYRRETRSVATCYRGGEGGGG